MVDIDKLKERPSFDGKVRALRVEDLGKLRPILATWVKDRETGESLPDEVEKDLLVMKNSVEGKNDRTYLVAETKEGEVIGVIGFKTPDSRMVPFTKTSRPAELVNAYVSSEHRKGSGVGRALVAKLEEEATKKGHTEIVLNSGPRYKETGWGFYDRLEGYQRVGVAEKYYGEGGDAPVWRKVLDFPALKLFDSLASESSYAERLKVLATIRTSIGGKLEGQLRGHEAGEWWVTVNPILDKLVKEDPQDALAFGVWLTTLPKAENSQQEWENRWHRGNGLVLLDDSRLRNQTVINLNNNERLRESVAGFLQFDPSQVANKEDTSFYPEAFLMVMDLKLLLGLDSASLSSEARVAVEVAKGKIKDPEVRRLVQIFGEISDTRQLYEFFVVGGYLHD